MTMATPINSTLLPKGSNAICGLALHCCAGSFHVQHVANYLKDKSLQGKVAELCICKLLLGHLKPVFNFSGYP